MPHVMVSEDGALSLSVGGKQYSCDDNGLVEVDDADVGHAIQHGFRHATDDEASMLSTSGDVTPATVATMSRPQLQAFLESREAEVPRRTAEMRAAALEILDNDADEAAGVAEDDGSNDGSAAEGEAKVPPPKAKAPAKE